MYTVADLMTRDVVTLRETDDLALADTVFRLGRIRHLPVADPQGRLLGLITHRDLLRCHAVRGEFFGRATLARDMMNTAVVTISAKTPLRDALRLMSRNKFGCLPVVDADNRLVGILTEADLVRLVAEMVDEFDTAAVPMHRS
jgi:CBS domain-containing protein